MLLENGWYRVTFTRTSVKTVSIYHVENNIVNVSFGRESVQNALSYGWVFEPVHVLSTSQYHELISGTNTSSEENKLSEETLVTILPVLNRVLESQKSLIQTFDLHREVAKENGFDTEKLDAALYDWETEHYKLLEAVREIESLQPKETSTPLEPCPFCGNDVLEPIQNEHGMWELTCQGCGFLNFGYFEEKKELIEFWNSRFQIGKNVLVSEGSSLSYATSFSGFKEI